MATINDFEHRRRERRRRERRRKKRIRAAILLIAFICLIVFLLIFISHCVNNSNTTETLSDTSAEQSTVTLLSNDSALPTPTPVSMLINVPPASEENNLMNIIENSGQKKHCYLTFDDGPTENITPQILDILRRYNVKATFFQIGSLIKTNSNMARRVYEEGHLIANHSDGHNYAKLYVSTDTFMNEVNDCYEAIKDVTGEENPFKLVRFPGGGFRSSADSYSPVKQQCKSELAEYGFYYCDWNALNGDAEGRTKDADELLEYLIDSAEGQNNVVVLMHDAAAKQATADALPSIIEYFISEGYTFHRLDDITYKAASADTDEDEDDNDDYDDDENSSSSSASPAPSASTGVSPSPSATASSGSSGGPIIIQ